MKQHTNNYLLQLFKEHGLDEGLDKIKIDNVNDGIVRIILQTIHNSRIALFAELESRVSKKNPNV